MFQLNVFATSNNNLQEALSELLTQLQVTRFNESSLIIAYFNVDFDGKLIRQWLLEQFPNTPFVLASSCQGTLSHSEQHNDPFSMITLMVIKDKLGSYFVEPAHPVANAFDQAVNTSSKLLENTHFEPPELLWVALSPGEEESILAGIQSQYGERLPIIGGSSADNDVSGQWQIFTHNSEKAVPMALVSITPSVKCSFYFSSGYAPTGVTAKVTQVSGRKLVALDNKNAASHYNQNTFGSISEQLSGGAILAESTLFPLGREIGEDEYLLSHPAAVTENSEIELFSEVHEGEQLSFMNGSSNSLLDRAIQVIDNACEPLDADTISGCIMIYCAGCMLGVKSEFHNIMSDIQNYESTFPVIGAYTFGEQGCFRDGSSRHGNLMISALVFGGADYDS